MYFISIPWTIDLFGSLSLGFVTEATEEELHERFPSRGRACKSKAAPPSKDPKGDKKKDVGKKSNGAQKDSDGPSVALKAVPKPKEKNTKAAEEAPEPSQPSKRLRKPPAEAAAKKGSPDPAAVLDEVDCGGGAGHAMMVPKFQYLVDLLIDKNLVATVTKKLFTVFWSLLWGIADQWNLNIPCIFSAVWITNILMVHVVILNLKKVDCAASAHAGMRQKK